MKIFQKGFNFSEDGPGNRLVYHLYGCNMRCSWCSNPECFSCDGEYTELSVKDVVNEAKSCRAMFFSGGGVTFTGGECTLDADGLIEALSALRKEGIHTAIETNGTSDRLIEISEEVDYLIMDFKHYDEEKLKSYTCMSAEIIKKNYKLLAESGRQLHIRIPLINEFNGDGATGFAEYFASLPHEGCVFEFLKYHEFGKSKWKTEYRIKDGFITNEQLDNFKQVFCEYGLKVVKS